MAELSPEARPRAHHYTYAHILLRNTAFTANEGMPTYGAMGLLGLAIKDKLTDHIVTQWRDFGASLPEGEEVVPATGFAVENAQLADHHVALITFPPPTRVSEVHQVALAHHLREARLRYLMLERGLPADDGEPTAVVSEWLGGGDDAARTEHGAVPRADPAIFRAEVERLLAAGHGGTPTGSAAPAGRRKRLFGLF